MLALHEIPTMVGATVRNVLQKETWLEPIVIVLCIDWQMSLYASTVVYYLFDCLGL